MAFLERESQYYGCAVSNHYAEAKTEFILRMMEEARAMEVFYHDLPQAR